MPVMSTPPKTGSSASNRASSASPRTPRGGSFQDKISFFEQVWSSGRSGSPEDLYEDVDGRRHGQFRSPTIPKTSARTGDSSFEESFERLVEEGELNGAKVVKFEKITVKKSVREIGGVAVSHQHRGLTEASRSPSDEHALEDSAYQSHSHGVASHGSKSSSITSFTRFPSEESLSQRRGSSPQQHLGPDDRTSAEWRAEYRSFGLQNASRIEYVRSKSEYDAHIAAFKGISSAWAHADEGDLFLSFFLSYSPSLSLSLPVFFSLPSLCLSGAVALGEGWELALNLRVCLNSRAARGGK